MFTFVEINLKSAPEVLEGVQPTPTCLNIEHCSLSSLVSCLQFDFDFRERIKKKWCCVLSACRETSSDTFNTSCVFISDLFHKQIRFSFDPYTCHMCNLSDRADVFPICFILTCACDYIDLDWGCPNIDKWIRAAAFTVLLNKVVWTEGQRENEALKKKKKSHLPTLVWTRPCYFRRRHVARTLGAESTQQ